MNRTATRTARAAATVALAAVALAACSSSGGRSTNETAAGNAGKATTPRMTVAFVTHAPIGDTFWDIVRKGAEVAAAKDNIDLQYNGDVDPSKQAQLIQASIDKKVDAMVVSDPNTGALGYFGQDESASGLAAGKRLATDGAKNVLCVIHNQGQAQLEARCDGIAKGLGSAAKALPAGSTAKIATFDTNKDLVAAIKDGKVQWAIDQQPYLQGYLAVDSLWLYKTNGDIIGGGQPTATGPSFVDKTNIDKVATFAANGTR